jgi:hypothetical protein
VDGYLLTDDSIGLNELVEIGGRFTLIMPSAQLVQTKPTWIITSQNLHPKLVSNKKPAKVNADRFGIFYCVDDPEMGQRTFNIIRYNVKNPGKITIEWADGKVKALYVEEGTEKDEKKELEGEVKVYDESKSSAESSQDKTLDIAENISNLKQAVSDFTFRTMGPSWDLVPELDDGICSDFQNFTCQPNSKLSVLSNAINISCEGTPFSFKARVCLSKNVEEIMFKLKEEGLVS